MAKKTQKELAADARAAFLWEKAAPERKKESERLRSRARRAANAETFDAPSRRWHAVNKDRGLDSHYRRNYGLTLEQVRAMSAAQNDTCPGCLRVPAEGEKLCVDHDHETGKVRGLVCDDCNVGMGRMKDDPAILLRLAHYLSTGT